MIFFSTPIWNQPMRFLNEQTSVGGLNHIGSDWEGKVVVVGGWMDRYATNVMGKNSDMYISYNIYIYMHSVHLHKNPDFQSQPKRDHYEPFSYHRCWRVDPTTGWKLELKNSSSNHNQTPFCVFVVAVVFCGDSFNNRKLLTFRKLPSKPSSQTSMFVALPAVVRFSKTGCKVLEINR